MKKISSRVLAVHVFVVQPHAAQNEGRSTPPARTVVLALVFFVIYAAITSDVRFGRYSKFREACFLPPQHIY